MLVASKRQEFSPEKMRARALKRFVRDSSKKGEEEAKRAHDAELTAISGLEVVAAWLEKRKIDLRIKKINTAEFDDEDMVIDLSGGLTREKQLVVLLHECGHVLIGKPKRTERYGMSKILDGERCTFRHRIDVVDEEFEAWHRGWKLARRLHVVVNRDLWESTKLWALTTYLKWAVRYGDFSHNDYSDMRDKQEN